MLRFGPPCVLDMVLTWPEVGQFLSHNGSGRPFKPQGLGGRILPRD